MTCTTLNTGGRALARSVDAIRARVDDALPDGGRALALVALTTHAGHFMGRAISNLLVFEAGGGAFIRDIGTWDPLPPHLAAPYALAGKAAQKAFWEPDPPALSMLAQLAWSARAIGSVAGREARHLERQLAQRAPAGRPARRLAPHALTGPGRTRVRSHSG